MHGVTGEGQSAKGHLGFTGRVYQPAEGGGGALSFFYHIDQVLIAKSLGHLLGKTSLKM